ncbi:MAG: 2Fe-2S iron-sulfur cluster-binding protein, partial [Planctomycetota bacterium]
MSGRVTIEVFRGEKGAGELVSYEVESDPGLVVLDVVHRVQAEHAPDLACRWNCKAGKCGSCSAEVNGRPALMCMKRMDTLPPDRPVTVRPIRTFPHVRDLV